MQNEFPQPVYHRIMFSIFLPVAEGMVGAAVFLVGVSYLNCTQTALAVTFLTLATTLSGVGLCGFFVNHMDIAPPYAGSLMGVSNGIAASAGFIAPLVAALLTTDVILIFLSLSHADLFYS